MIRGLGLSGFFILHRDLLELAREVAVEVRGAGGTIAACAAAAGAGARVVGVVDRLLPHRPLAHRPGGERALPRPLPQRGADRAAGHRPRLPARHPRGPDPARARPLRPRPLRAGGGVPDLQVARRDPRGRQGAGAAAGGDRARGAGGGAVGAVGRRGHRARARRRRGGGRGDGHRARGRGGGRRRHQPVRRAGRGDAAARGAADGTRRGGARARSPDARSGGPPRRQGLGSGRPRRGRGGGLRCAAGPLGLAGVAGARGVRAAAPSLAAPGRDDRLHAAADRLRPARARRHGGAADLPLGQGLLRGRGLSQDRPARPRDAVGGRALRRGDRAHALRADRPVADPVRRRGDLRVHPGRRHDGRVPDREPGADAVAAAHQAGDARRPDDPGRDRAAGADRRRRGQPVHRAQADPAHEPGLPRSPTTTRRSSRCSRTRSARSSSRTRCSRWRWRSPASRRARRRGCGGR